MVCTLVLALGMHGKRVVTRFLNYLGNSSFALQLPPSKPPPGIRSDYNGNYLRMRRSTALLHRRAGRSKSWECHGLLADPMHAVHQAYHAPMMHFTARLEMRRVCLSSWPVTGDV